MAAKKQKRGRYLPTTYNLTKQARELLLTLIANMIGDKNRIPDMGSTRVLPEMIPVSDDDRLLNAARTVLQLMYRAAENGVPPTQENILNGLALEYGDDAPELMEHLMTKRGFQDAEQSEIVRANAMWLSEELGLGTLRAAVSQMEDVVGRAEGRNAEIHQEMSGILLKASPQRYSVVIRELEENYDEYLDLLMEREAAIKTKGSTGPESPWPLLNRMIAGLKPGEYSLWSAKTGYGKSFVAWKLAKHIAWEQGYNVLLLHFEQRMESIMDRMMAETFKLFPSDFRNPGRKLDPKQTGVFLPSDPEWQKRLKAVRQHIVKKTKENGHLWLAHSTGWGPFEIETEVANKTAISEAEGRKLVVIIDYYDLISPKGLDVWERSKVAMLEATIDFIRDTIAQQYQAYVIVFAQDNVKADYEVDFMPYNSQRVWARSQVYVRIERQRAEEPLAILDQEGKHAKDMFGRPMFYHDTGEAHCDTLLHVIKGSDDKTGYVPVRVWNGRFKVDELKLTHQELRGLISTINATRKPSRSRDRNAEAIPPAPSLSGMHADLN